MSKKKSALKVVPSTPAAPPPTDPQLVTLADSLQSQLNTMGIQMANNRMRFVETEEAIRAEMGKVSQQLISVRQKMGVPS